MNLWIYTSKAPKNLVSKDTVDPDTNPPKPYLYLRFGLTGQLMENTSLTDPVIEIELYKGMRVYEGNISSYHENTNFDELLNMINKCNYIDMADFETYNDGTNKSTRCCFINEIELGNYYEERDELGNITVARMTVRLYCHVDVLMTYRYIIKGSTKALVVGQEGAADDDLYYDTRSFVTSVPESIIVDGESPSGYENFGTGSLVLLTVGKGVV